MLYSCCLVLSSAVLVLSRVLTRVAFKTRSNLACVLIYSLTKCVLGDGFKDNCALKTL